MIGAQWGPRRRAAGESGITIIIVAAALVGILTVVAIVIDLSNVRNTRQQNRSTSDAVVTAGLQELAPDGVPRPWRGVCSALDYLRANEPNRTLDVSYRDGTGNTVSGTPCSSFVTQECVPSTPTSWAWIHASEGDFVVDIKSGYVTPDPAFSEDATIYGGDNGDVASGGCDQLAVILGNSDAALFGGIVGTSEYNTQARSVGRVRISMQNDGVPAFLMLERKACDTLSEQVGSGADGIIVDPASATEPGIIHVDSSGSPGAGCNGNNNPDGWAVYSSGTGGAKIKANPSADGQPGIIAIHALQVGVPPTAYGGSTVAGLSPAPISGRVVSRKPVDEKYNPGSAPTISNVHAAAHMDAIRTSAPPDTYPTSRPGPWTTFSCGSAGAGSATATKVFVNCLSGFSAGNPTTFSAATDIVFNGPVDVGNNKQLYLPAARRVVVGGTSNGGLSVAGGGQLGINATPFANTDAGVSSACAPREGPGWAQTTEMTIFGGRSSGSTAGALNIGGRGALCQTFVYLAGPKDVPTYARAETTNGTYDPSCLPAKPCASNTGAAATNAFFNISGLAQWSAPNQLTVQPAPGNVGVEDLALWTESASQSDIKSGGDLRTRGVFFLPNARVEMRSPASATPRDAQFISRTLQLLQGVLRMQPTPGNNVQIPVLSGYGLVR